MTNVSNDEMADLATSRGQTLVSLGTQLGSAGFRIEFLADPQAAMAAQGIDHTVLDEEFIDGLVELSTTELRLVGSLTELLRKLELGGGQFPF